MGVRGLSSFITQNPDICKPFKLHDTTVIVDGSNLIHSLYYNYKLDFRYGGEYKEYYDCVREYMSSFLACNIQPIVIIDGGYEKSDRQLNSTIERLKQSLTRAQSIARGELCPYPVFPLFMIKVFCAALLDLGIQLANCDYAADGQVAALGNYYKCPIISNDSDFYIFDVLKGVIRLDSIDSTINLDIDSDGKEYKCLNCKIYYIDEFVKRFSGLNKSTLPLFGTLIGTEFVEPETFDKFFSNIHLPYYESKGISFDLNYDKHKKMVGLLCWLQHKSLNKAVNEVTSYFEKNDQEYIKSIIDISLRGYELHASSLRFIFDRNIDDPQNDLLSNSMLTTPCKNPLPQTFVLKFHQVQLPKFFINVIFLHTVFLQGKIEDMEMKSSHSCSSHIRQVLYGILVRHDVKGTECKNKECHRFIEEYDRQGNCIQKEQVQPIFSLKGIGLLPKINEVDFIEKKQCIKILAKVLGVNTNYFLTLPDTWQLFLGSINYWLRISGCRSEAFVSAIILNLMYFGLMKNKNSGLNQKRCPRITLESNKCNCSSIACRIANVKDSDLKYAGKVLDGYYNNPTLKPDKRLFLNVAHSFSQIQSCLLHITYLNQLLNDCLKNLDPQNCFSGIMLYNLTESIKYSAIPNMLIGKILGKDLNLLFTQLKSKVCENVPCFSVTKKSEPVRKEKQKYSRKSFI